MRLSEHEGTGRVAGAQRMQRKNAVKTAFDHLQTHFRAELSKFTDPAALGKNRGNALTSAERGMLLAERRKYSKIKIANTGQAHHLALLSRGMHWAGNGMIALDAGIRIRGVHSTYKNGGNWQRQAVIQTAGFGAAGVAGILTAQAAVGTLTTIGLAATPLGWVVLIAIAASAAYVTASGADKIGQSLAEAIYDRKF